LRRSGRAFASRECDELNVMLNKILRLTYRLNFPNNNVKIWDLEISRGKLFTFRDLWDINGEGIGAQKNYRKKISEDFSSREEGQAKSCVCVVSWEGCIKA